VKFNSTAGLKGCFLVVVPGRGFFFRYVLPLLCWLGLIFLGSSDLASSARTSRILDPLVRWILPALSDETVEQTLFLLRKIAHLVTYGILAILIWRALRQPVREDVRPWSWAEAMWALGGAVACAIADEVHQAWVVSRHGTLSDVMLDAVGACLGLLLLRAWGQWRGRW
jgi:VanZ family protein